MPTVGKGRYTRVSLEGPFFTGDAAAKFSGNLAAAMDDMAAEMETEVERLIEGRAGNMPFYTGRSARAVHGRAESVSGRPWYRTAVVSAFTGGMGRKDAIRTKAAAASIERRFHPFRRVASAGRRIRRDLTQGLA